MSIENFKCTACDHEEFEIYERRVGFIPVINKAPSLTGSLGYTIHKMVTLISCTNCGRDAYCYHLRGNKWQDHSWVKKLKKGGGKIGDLESLLSDLSKMGGGK